MGISNTDFLGAASLLSGLGRAVGEAGSGQSGQVQAQEVLACLEQLGTTSAARLAEALKQAPDAIQPHIAKLVDLRFVAQEGEDESAVYALTDLGRQARKLARIAQSG